MTMKRIEDMSREERAELLRKLQELSEAPEEKKTEAEHGTGIERPRIQTTDTERLGRASGDVPSAEPAERVQANEGRENPERILQTSGEQRTESSREPDKDRGVSGPSVEPGDSGRDSGSSQRLSEPPTSAVPETSPAHDLIIERGTDIGATEGATARFNANLDAIRTLKAIEKDNRKATPQEQAILAKYSGFGDSAFERAFKPRGYGDKDAMEVRGGALKEMTTPEEYSAIERSRLNAFYTSPEVVNATWDALKQMGADKLTKPRVLEPSAGSGRFLGLEPTDLAARSVRTAVELDSLTGRMLKQMYPQTDVYVMGYEKAPLPKESVDIAISNVPFGDFPVNDPSFKRGDRKMTRQIHNYFFAKTLQQLRPGGVLAFVTSHNTLDAVTHKDIRESLAEQADLVGAIRLPAGAFKDTQVVTDIIFMRKRLSTDQPGDKSWVDTDKVTLKTKSDRYGYGYDTEQTVNKYFLQHPEMVLGINTATGTMYGRGDAYNVEPDPARPLSTALPMAVKRLPKDVIVDAPYEERPHYLEGLPTESSIFNNTRVIDKKGHVYIKSGSSLVNANLSSTDETKVKDMLAIRDAGRAAVKVQLEEGSDPDIKASQETLRKLYQAFVLKNGALSSPQNTDLLKNDPDQPFLEALENKDSLRKPKDKRDEKDARIIKILSGKEKVTAKDLPNMEMPIFSERVIRGMKAKNSVTDYSDAETVVRNEVGRLDFNRMAGLLGKNKDDVINDLAGKRIIFKNPLGDWEPADQYLSGDVREKLKVAENAATAKSEYRVNVEALKSVQPEEISAGQISVSLGAPWIPAKDVNDFIKAILEANHGYYGYGRSGDNYFNYNQATGAWTDEDRIVAREAKLMNEWGTPRMPANALIDRILNSKPIEVMDKVTGPDGKDHSVRNVQETILAQEKAKAVQDKFIEWLWSDVDRAKRLAAVYNDRFNNFRPRVFDGSHQVLPGMDKAWNKKLHGHQRDAIWRMVQDRTTLLAHEVGFGKAQPHDAKVMTPFGWKLMGDIEVGDYVIGDDGFPAPVVGVYPQGIRPIFKVIMSDGSFTECTDEHLWLTWTYQERINRGRMPEDKDWECAKPHVRELSEIRKTLRAHKIQAKNHSIPMVEPVAFPTRPTPLDPYLVGVLLGDGYISGGGIKFSSADTEIVESVRELVPAGVNLRQDGEYDYHLTISREWAGKPRHGRHPVLEAVRDLKIAVKSSEKFIPDCYKFNDISVRLAILQGLMDTDGTVFKNGLAVSFTSISQRLAEDVQFLVQSFGGTARITSRTPHFTHNGELKDGQLAYTVAIRLPAGIPPFRLARKANRVTPFTKYPPVRYIADVQQVEDKPATCILVDNLTHLFVTDDFIVTHNTAVMVAGGMELRRLGLSRKNLYVVPKATHAQFTQQFQELYPFAKILFPGVDDFSTESRAQFVARAQTGDWDAIILSDTQFKKIPVKPETEIEITREEIEAYKEALQNEEESSEERSEGYSGRRRGGESRTHKEIEKAIIRLEEKIAEQQAKLGSTSDKTTYFEDLGIDQLIVDEADMFKNLKFATRMGRIKGLPNSDSDRSWDIYTKIRHMQRGNGRGVVFATGTPIANTVAEMYTQMRYLQPDTLEAKGLKHFDAWAKTFGETTETLEQTPTGQYRMTQRFAKFQNAPELSGMWQQVADIRVADEVPELVAQRPRLVDEQGKAKRTVIKTPADKALLDYMKKLAERADDLKGKDPREDNMLKIASDARLASLDMRMVEADAPVNQNGKVAQASKRIAQIYKDETSKKGTQLVFLDIGTPKAKDKDENAPKAKPAVMITEGGETVEVEDENEETVEEAKVLRNVYANVKKQLVFDGVPEDEIAFIHDAKNDDAKKKLYAKVNSGDIRVIIGSTGKMGAGVNIQKRACALHHLDCPWRPRDIEQREGRVIRQGNEMYGPKLDDDNKVIDPGPGVKIYTYVTERSFDAYMWQAVEAKAKAIKAIMKRHAPPRSIDDIDSLSMSAGEAKAIASGNPDVLKQVTLKNSINRLQLLRSSWMDSKIRANERIRNIPALSESYQKEIVDLEKDLPKAEKPKSFKMVLEGQPYNERAASWKKIEDMINSSKDYDPMFAPVVGQYRGLDVKMLNYGPQGGYKVIMHSNESGKDYATTAIPFGEVSGDGAERRMDGVIDAIPSRLFAAKEDLASSQKNINAYKEQSEKPFDYQGQLDTMLGELGRISAKLQKIEVGGPSDNYVPDAETGISGELTDEPLTGETPEPEYHFSAKAESTPQIKASVKEDMPVVAQQAEDNTKAIKALVEEVKESSKEKQTERVKDIDDLYGEKIRSGYLETLAEIEADTTLTKEERASQIAQLRETTGDKLDEEKSDAEKQSIIDAKEEAMANAKIKRNERLRGHKLLPKELEKQLPGLYSTEKIPESDKKVIAKFFHPLSQKTLYAVEYDPEDRIFFGYTDNGYEQDSEWGNFSLDELEELNVKGLPMERDTGFKPQAIKDVRGLADRFETPAQAGTREKRNEAIETEIAKDKEASQPEIVRRADEGISKKRLAVKKLPDLDAEIRKIAPIIEYGKDTGDYEVEVGLQESLGESGGDIVSWQYKGQPTVEEIRADILSHYEETAKDLGTTDIKSGREEMVEKAINKVLAKSKTEIVRGKEVPVETLAPSKELMDKTEGVRIARDLGIHFEDVQEGYKDVPTKYQFTDPETGSTLHASTEGEAKSELLKMRALFEKPAKHELIEKWFKASFTVNGKTEYRTFNAYDIDKALVVARKMAKDMEGTLHGVSETTEEVAKIVTKADKEQIKALQSSRSAIIGQTFNEREAIRLQSIYDSKEWKDTKEALNKARQSGKSTRALKDRLDELSGLPIHEGSVVTPSVEVVKGEVTEAPWKMTANEYLNSRQSGPFALDAMDAKILHHDSTQEALRAGKPVPQKVLDDYGVEEVAKMRGEPLKIVEAKTEPIETPELNPERRSQMTLKNYQRQMLNDPKTRVNSITGGTYTDEYIKQLARDIHKADVSNALKEGKVVPTEVLNDYPELVAKSVSPIVKGSQSYTLPVNVAHYIRGIRNKKKLDYANRYAHWLHDGEKPSERPRVANLSVMAQQAVEHEILDLFRKVAPHGYAEHPNSQLMKDYPDMTVTDEQRADAATKAHKFAEKSTKDEQLLAKAATNIQQGIAEQETSGKRIPEYKNLPDAEVPPYQLYKRWQEATGYTSMDKFGALSGKFMLSDIAEAKEKEKKILLQRAAEGSLSPTSTTNMTDRQIKILKGMVKDGELIKQEMPMYSGPGNRYIYRLPIPPMSKESEAYAMKHNVGTPEGIIAKMKAQKPVVVKPMSTEALKHAMEHNVEAPKSKAELSFLERRKTRVAGANQRMFQKKAYDYKETPGFKSIPEGLAFLSKEFKDKYAVRFSKAGDKFVMWVREKSGSEAPEASKSGEASLVAKVKAVGAMSTKGMAGLVSKVAGAMKQDKQDKAMKESDKSKFQLPVEHKTRSRQVDFIPDVVKGRSNGKKVRRVRLS